MKPKTIILTLLVLMALAMIPAQAQTITMSAPGGIVERDVIVYWPNGSLQGFYNSTSVITLDSGSDYIFALKPVGSDPLSSPTEWFTLGFIPWIKTNALVLIVIGFLIMLWRKGR